MGGCGEAVLDEFGGLDCQGYFRDEEDDAAGVAGVECLVGDVEQQLALAGAGDAVQVGVRGTRGGGGVGGRRGGGVGDFLVLFEYLLLGGGEGNGWGRWGRCGGDGEGIGERGRGVCFLGAFAQGDGEHCG